MRGGCTKYRNSRRRLVTDASESESNDPFQSEPVDYPGKKLEFGSNNADTVDIAGTSDEQGCCSVGGATLALL